ESDVKTLPAAAFALGLRVLKLEGFVQTLLDEVHHGTVDQGQTRPIDHDFDPARLENGIIRMNLIGVIHYICDSGAAGFLDADAQAEPRATLLQVRTNSISSRLGQKYRHSLMPLDDLWISK